MSKRTLQEIFMDLWSITMGFSDSKEYVCIDNVYYLNLGLGILQELDNEANKLLYVLGKGKDFKLENEKSL